MCLLLASGAAAETGTVTQLDGGARLLRGATWYTLAAGAPIEDADIVDAAPGAQVQIEFASGTIANLVGPGALYVAAAPAKGGLFPATLTGGWLKLAAKAPGWRIQLSPFDAATADGIVVAHAEGTGAAAFVEAGAAILIELAPNGTDATKREARQGEYVSKTMGAAFATAGSAPKAFVGAMPRHFIDPLPALAATTKAKPTLVADRDITYAEAEPWLAGRDRVAFEKRFAGRLRDPAFRKSAEPDLARHPAWDRIVHPEKYLPKDKPAPRLLSPAKIE
jgi:hypothetical protein